MNNTEAQNKAIHSKAKMGKKERPTRAGFPNGAKGGIYGGMHLDEAMRHEERRIKKNSNFDHEQHAKHNRNIEAIDKKMGIGKYNPHNYKK